MAGDLTKLTVNLTPRAFKALDVAADRCGDTRTDTVNRALLIYDTLTQAMHEVAANGGVMELRSDDTAWLDVTVVVGRKRRYPWPLSLVMGGSR